MSWLSEKLWVFKYLFFVVSYLFISSLSHKGKKRQLFMCLMKYHATYWGVEVQLDAFLALALHGDELLASCLSHFTCGERNPGTHWTEGWVGPRGNLGTVVKRINPHPCWESNPGHTACSLDIIVTELTQS
jgi:hypothetical protein